MNYCLNKSSLMVIAVICQLALILPVVAEAAQPAKQELSLQAMIEKVISNYPTVMLATIEIEKSRQELAKVESQLGWVLAAQTGIGHDVTFIDAPTDRFDAGANLGRRYDSGIKFDVSGKYTYEDSSTSFSPFVPNPSERAALDLKWRIPFGRGEDNPEYSQGRVLAESAYEAQKANQTFLIDNLIQQGINLYYDAAETYMRILDAEKSIDRSIKLKNYIQRNRNLGLAEKKDMLIIQAQVDRLTAARDSLLIAWGRQKSEINRLTGAPQDTDFVLLNAYQDIDELATPQSLLELVYARDPQIQFQKSRLKNAEANIILTKNTKEEQLDVVLSVGARAAKGDTGVGVFDEQEWAGQARLEYLYELDQRGFDATIYQAMLDKRRAEEELAKLKHDIDYSTDSLIKQITDNKNAVRSNKKRLDVENEKLADALQRYKEGRADTREVIEFENDLFASSLIYENQRLQLARTYANLNLVLGRLWRTEVLDERRGLQQEQKP